MGKLTIQQCNQLYKQVGTPCFLINEDLFIENIQRIKCAFQKEYNNTIVSYSFKTNYIPYICKLAKNNGCKAEVVSYLEYQIAKQVGFAPKDIIMNSPLKRYEEFETAILEGAQVNIDSFYELSHLELIRKNHPNEELKVGIRVNVPIVDENGVSAIYGEEKVGRFGFVDDEIPDVVRRLRELNCEIICIHGHTSSKNRAIFNYIQISRRLIDVAEKYSLKPQYLDLGGGYFGPVPQGMFTDRHVPAYEEYATEIFKYLNKDEWFKANKPSIIIEPGMSVAASSMSYIARVHDIKHRVDRRIAQTDGTMFHVRQNMADFNLPFYIVAKEKTLQEQEETVHFAGASCMESDLIRRCTTKQKVDVGDYIVIDNVGAYTFVMASSFIQYLPYIAVVNGNGINKLRQSRDFDNFIEVFSV